MRGSAAHFSELRVTKTLLPFPYGSSRTSPAGLLGLDGRIASSSRATGGPAAIPRVLCIDVPRRDGGHISIAEHGDSA